MRKVVKADCSGCYNDIYNHNDMVANMSSGQPQCWSFATATLEKAIDIPIDMPPPYRGMPETTRPFCYRRQRYTRVKKERLTKDGYWR